MNLYKNYCYQDIQTVAESVQSEVALAGFGLIGSVSVFSPSQLTIDYSTADGSSHSVLLSFPACGQLGFNNSYTGLTLDDSIELSGLILFVLVTVYTLKVLRRAL